MFLHLLNGHVAIVHDPFINGPLGRSRDVVPALHILGDLLVRVARVGRFRARPHPQVRSPSVRRLPLGVRPRQYARAHLRQHPFRRWGLSFPENATESQRHGVRLLPAAARLLLGVGNGGQVALEVAPGP